VSEKKKKSCGRIHGEAEKVNFMGLTDSQKVRALRCKWWVEWKSLVNLVLFIFSQNLETKNIKKGKEKNLW